MESVAGRPQQSTGVEISDRGAAHLLASRQAGPVLQRQVEQGAQVCVGRHPGQFLPSRQAEPNRLTGCWRGRSTFTFTAEVWTGRWTVCETSTLSRLEPGRVDLANRIVAVLLFCIPSINLDPTSRCLLAYNQLPICVFAWKRAAFFDTLPRSLLVTILSARPSSQLHCACLDYRTLLSPGRSPLPQDFRRPALFFKPSLLQKGGRRSHVG